MARCVFALHQTHSHVTDKPWGRQPLLHKPLVERRQLLREHFKQVPGEFDFAKSSDGETTEEIQAFLEESVKDGCEGLMVKMLEGDASFYEPSRRRVNWLKVCLL